MDDNTKQEIDALYDERSRIENFLKPKPSAEFLKWGKAAQQRLAAIEQRMREVFFPSPKEEGMQRVTDDGYAVALETSLNRKIDPAILPKCLERLPEGTEEKLIRWVPELDVKAYKALGKKQRAIFDECLTSKSGKPSFEIVRVETPED